MLAGSLLAAVGIWFAFGGRGLANPFVPRILHPEDAAFDLEIFNGTPSLIVGSDLTLSASDTGFGLEPAIDPDFRVDGRYGTDRINGLHTFLSALQTAHDLAFRPYEGREIASDYSYDGTRDITIRVSGWPVPRFIFRKFVLWALVESLMKMVQDRPYLSSAKFTLNMATRKVGELAYRGPNTRSEAGGYQEMANNSVGSNELGSMSYTNEENATSTGNETTPGFIDDRPGELVIIPNWQSVNIAVNQLFINTIGLIVFVAAQPLAEETAVIDISMKSLSAHIVVRPSESPFHIPLRNCDLINGMEIFVQQAVAQTKFKEAIVEFKWKFPEYTAILGTVYVANTRDKIALA